uniref:Immunoglobulin V-set domain-containing protein n=1 Tax=Podarcis muralis TaxID=64176 RepID=A0A670JAR0_PODMU
MRVWRTMTLLIWGLLPGCMSVLIGPEALGGFLGKSLSVMCKYEYWYQTYKKYWCKGSSWNKCSVVVQTTGSEEEVKAGRMSIKDNHTNLEFTVRMESLTQQDAGIYWCGIKKRGYDPGFRIHITVLPDPEETTAISSQTDLDPSLNTTDNVHLIYVLFTLKTLILLGLGIAMIWMHRRQSEEIFSCHVARKCWTAIP